MPKNAAWRARAARVAERRLRLSARIVKILGHDEHVQVYEVRDHTRRHRRHAPTPRPRARSTDAFRAREQSAGPEESTG